MEHLRKLFKDLKKVSNTNPDLKTWNEAISKAEGYPEIYRFLKNIPYIDCGHTSFDESIRKFKFGGSCKFDNSEGSIIDWVMTINPKRIRELNVDYLAGFESLYRIIEESSNFHNNPLQYEYGKDLTILFEKDIVVTSCDVKYFNFYSESFCSTFFAHNKERALVINLIFDKLSDNTSLLVDNLQSTYDDLVIIYSKTSDNRKSLFANGRFLILNELFDADVNSITTVDIDCVFKGPVDLFHKAMKLDQSSIGLIISPAIQFPWYYTMAGFVYFPKCEKIRSQIKHLISLISSLYTIKNDQNYWYSDQNALLIFFIMYKVNVTRVGSEHLKKIWNQVGANSKGLVAPE